MIKYLSIFIDESGDFGKYDRNAPFYMVTMLFHDQSQNIAEEITGLDEGLAARGFPKHCLHTGPLIRREDQYKYWDIDLRKNILNAFMAFASKINFRYRTFTVAKEKDGDPTKISNALAVSILGFLKENFSYFNSFDQIYIYYDNGQKQVSGVLAKLFSDSKVQFKQKVSPSFYKLFQLCDLITTFELINLKRQRGENSSSEKMFFGSMRKFTKNYYERISKKKF